MNTPRRILRLRLILAWAVLTGSPSVVRAGTDTNLNDPAPVGDLRPLDPAVWGRKAVSYSGFRAGQSPETGVLPSREEIRQDLTLLRDAGFGLIRVYGSGGHGRDVVETIAKTGLDIRVQLGAYLGGSRSDKGDTNRAEIEAAIELANAHPDVVAAVSVGNETLVSWSFVPVPPADMIAYVREVRSRVKQPVTVNDNWAPYAAAAGTELARVWGQIDYASVHTYAYWDAGFNLWDFRQLDVPEERRARAMMDAAAAYARANFAAVRAALDAAGRRIPIVIGETGWQDLPTAFVAEAPVKDFAAHEAHPVNQAWYFADMLAWAYGKNSDDRGDGFSRPAAMFYFSAFDEPWKKADDHWGLWDAARQPKLVLRPDAASAGAAVFYRETGQTKEKKSGPSTK
jgi:exo-beta-1,3-glucanase (GH17 family)